MTYEILNGATVPADTTTDKYYKLYKVSVAGSPAKASITTICRPFAIEGGVQWPDSILYQPLIGQGTGTDPIFDWLRWA